MSAEYLLSTTPVVVTSFAYTNDGIPERIYYVVKLKDDARFLKKTMRMLAKNSWTIKLKKAALFDTSERARQMVSRSFSNVSLDL